MNQTSNHPKWTVLITWYQADHSKQSELRWRHEPNAADAIYECLRWWSYSAETDRYRTCKLAEISATRTDTQQSIRIHLDEKTLEDLLDDGGLYNTLIQKLKIADSY